jgi:hypothetical protein
MAPLLGPLVKEARWKVEVRNGDAVSRSDSQNGNKRDVEKNRE